MGSTRRSLDIVDAALREAVGFGLCHVDADDTPLDGRRVEIDGRPRLNFTSCSYLGLELDPRLVRGASDALERYGTQFSASRGYISAPLYAELEELLSEFGEVAPAAEEIELPQSYQVVVEVASEDQQRQLYERMTQEGLRCRSLTL